MKGDETTVPGRPEPARTEPPPSSCRGHAPLCFQNGFNTQKKKAGHRARLDRELVFLAQKTRLVSMKTTVA